MLTASPSPFSNGAITRDLLAGRPGQPEALKVHLAPSWDRTLSLLSNLGFHASGSPYLTQLSINLLLLGFSHHPSHLTHIKESTLWRVKKESHFLPSFLVDLQKNSFYVHFINIRKCGQAEEEKYKNIDRPRHPEITSSTYVLLHILLCTDPQLSLD